MTPSPALIEATAREVKVMRWVASKNALWIAISENGQPWLSTASSISKNRSIARWAEETEKSWAYWRRHGYHCRKAKIKYQVQP